MIRVELLPLPPDVDAALNRRLRISRPEGAVENTERALAELFYQDATNRERLEPFRKPGFAIYRTPIVKKSLIAIFHGKCAYCEAKIAGSQPVDVEHYRPKAEVTVAPKVTKLGYYWLATEWTNLLPSCRECNSERKKEFVGDRRLKSGKANYFPLEDEDRRAAWPGEEAGEAPLLLHPYFDEPEEHLEFMAEGIVRARKRPNGATSRKGAESIKIYGLDRIELFKERRDWFIRIEGVKGRIAKYLERIESNANNDEARQDLDEALTELESYCDASERFAGMARQIVCGFDDDIGDRIETAIGRRIAVAPKVAQHATTGRA